MPGDVAAGIAERVAKRRKERGWSQRELAERSGVSLGSLRRFEQIHEISLNSLLALAFALGCESDFDALFATAQYATMDDVVAAAERGAGDGR